MKIISVVLFSLAVAASIPSAYAVNNKSRSIDESIPRREAEEVLPISFYGLNYNTRKGPDWAADRERCKSRDEVVRDLQILSRITRRIRLLSLVDCNQGALVWSILDEELSDTTMEVWLGLWVGPDPQVFTDEYESLVAMIPNIKTSRNWQRRLSGITVGSEAIYREDINVTEAIANLDTTRGLMEVSGMSDVPVAIVDIAPIYSNSQELRLASDTIMTNTFPFWEGVDIEWAVDELEVDLGWLLGLPESQGKSFVLSEHGWPAEGFLDDVGIASPENQQRYTEESYCYLREKGWAYYWFTAIDNDWRQLQDPENTIEGNWGFLTADLELKEHFVDFQFSCADGTTFSFGAIDWTLPELPTEEPIDPANASCGLWQGCEALAGNCCPTPAGAYLGCCRSENFLGPASNTTPMPTSSPTKAPTQVTENPTPMPTSSPTKAPTQSAPLTENPTSIPTVPPTEPVAVAATADPTKSPTNVPTSIPTKAPTEVPTATPTKSPTNLPTNNPTMSPTDPPTLHPTAEPTKDPTTSPVTDTTSEETSSTTIFPPEVVEEEIFPWDANGGALPPVTTEDSSKNKSGARSSNGSWKRTILLLLSSTAAIILQNQ